MFNPLPAIALLPLCADLVRPGQRQPGLRAHPLGAVGGRAEHAFRLPVACRRRCAWSAATTACAGCRYVVADPDSGGVPSHPDRPEDRLGVRLAHADRGRAGVRRVVGLGRAGLVHLREQERARHSRRVRRPAHGDRDRPAGRKRDLPHHRDAGPCASGACRTDVDSRRHDTPICPIRWTIRASTSRFR